jgi:hypothetical protein
VDEIGKEKRLNTWFTVALQVAVDYSTSRRCWLEMIRLWAIKMRHDAYDKTLATTLHTIIASHRRSQQVRKRLQLKQVILNRGSNISAAAAAAAAGDAAPAAADANDGASAGAGAKEGQRLPVQYAPMVSAEDDEDVAAGVLPEVAGGVDQTAAQLARLAAGGNGREAEQQQGNGGDGVVDHLPPANGGDDVYTLLKMYNISSTLVSAKQQWRQDLAITSIFSS